MIRAKNIRTLLKDVGPAAFRGKLREMLGVQVKNNPDGTFPAKLDESKAQISPEEFSVRNLAEEFLGSEFVAGVSNGKTSDSWIAELREANNPVLASQMQDVNTFNATLGGLIEAKILEGYANPAFISQDLFENQPSSVNGGRMIGIVGLQLPDGPTDEGQELPNLGMQPRYVTVQKSVKYGNKLSLTKECVTYDLTGDLLTSAERMGYSLGYIREYWCAGVAQGRDIVAGTPGFQAARTCNTFIYDDVETATPNATYQTSAGTGASLKYNFVNSLSNPLVDWKDVQDVQAKLNLMREPETGLPILAPLEEVVVSPNTEYNARAVIHATQVLDTSGASGLSTSGGVGTFAANPVPTLRIFASPVWNKQLVDSGLSQANADAYWYAGSLKRAFVWREIWPLSVVQGNPTSSDMLERDIVNSWFGSWRGVPVVRDPHYCVQSTN